MLTPKAPAVLGVLLVCLTVTAGAQQPGAMTVTDPFDGPLGARWRPAGGTWEPDNGRLMARGSGRLYLVEQAWRDVEAHVTVRFEKCPNPAYWVGISLHADATKAPGSGCLVYLRRDGRLEIFADGRIAAAVDTDAAQRFDRGESVRLGARIRGGHVEGFLDGKALVSSEWSGEPWGELALGTYDVSATFDEFTCTGTPAGGAIYGEVVTLADQQPAAGVTVETYHSFDGYPSIALASTTTDGDGRYQLPDLPLAEKGYWVRAVADGYGGGTGWFVTVEERRPTKLDLQILRPPSAGSWVDSPRSEAPEPWVETPDPQAFGGSRSVIRALLADGLPAPLACSFKAAASGTFVLHIASGLYETPHYWGAFEWRIDGGDWRGSDALTIEGARYGDRLSLVWARTKPLQLDPGDHLVEFRPSGAWVGGAEYYWTFDALAVEQLPDPTGPETAGAMPTLTWSGDPSREVVLQLSHEPDFSDGTVTIPHLTGGAWTVPVDWRLADGIYWWRVKPAPTGPSVYAGAFGSPAKLTVATDAPAIGNVRERIRSDGRATIEWTTDDACESWIEYDLSAVEPRYRTAPSGGTAHVADLTDLAPMTCYRYWIVARTPGGLHRGLRRQFLTRRGPLEGRQSPFSVFGQSLPYAKQFADAGANWMSDYWDWKTLEPEPGRFVWDHAEERMERAREAGLNLTVTFWGSPDWSRPSHVGEHAWDFTFGPEDPAQTEEFFRRLADHCRGRVDWFLPWIEPNVGRDPVFGFPRGYWASRPHAETYAAHERAAYLGAKRGNPDCRLVGMNTAGVDLAFIERCYDEGAAGFFDVMNVHYYAPSAPFEAQQPEALFGRLRKLMAQYGDAEKPIICSEGGGASSGLEGTDEATQARHLVRIYIISIANDISHLSWTFSHDVKPYGSAQVDMIMWMGLFRYDPDPDHLTPDLRGEPKPAYFALRNMAKLLEGSSYRRRVRLGDGVRAYAFDRGSERITVLWSEGEPQPLSLPLTGQVERVVSHLGEELPADLRDGSLSLTATEDPVFVVEGR